MLDIVIDKNDLQSTTMYVPKFQIDVPTNVPTPKIATNKNLN